MPPVSEIKYSHRSALICFFWEAKWRVIHGMRSRCSCFANSTISPLVSMTSHSFFRRLSGFHATVSYKKTTVQYSGMSLSNSQSFSRLPSSSLKISTSSTKTMVFSAIMGRFSIPSESCCRVKVSEVNLWKLKDAVSSSIKSFSSLST